MGRPVGEEPLVVTLAVLTVLTPAARVILPGTVG